MSEYNLEDYWSEKGKEPVSRDKRQTKRLEKFCAFLNICNNIDSFSDVLDIGCGDGRLYSYFKEKNVLYHGIDISKARVEMFKEKYPSALVENRNFLDSAYDDYDLVVCIDVMQHNKKSDILNFLKKVRQICNKHFVFIEPDPKATFTNLEPHCFIHDYPKLLVEAGFELKYTYQLDELKKMWYAA